MPEPVHVYRDGKIYVRGAQCGRCLFSRERLVDRERARDLIQSTLASEGPFVCHRSQVSDEPEAICHVWFNTYGERVMELRLAVALDMIVMTDPTEEDKEA